MNPMPRKLSTSKRNDGSTRIVTTRSPDGSSQKVTKVSTTAPTLDPKPSPTIY